MRFDQNIRIKFGSLYVSRHEPEAYAMLARMYWAVLICFAALLMILGITYGTWEFLTPLPEAASSGVRPQLTVSKAQLEKILQGFEERSKAYDAHRRAPASIKDPS